MIEDGEENHGVVTATLISVSWAVYEKKKKVFYQNGLAYFEKR
jgi:hypothetical protein